MRRQSSMPKKSMSHEWAYGEHTVLAILNNPLRHIHRLVVTDDHQALEQLAHQRGVHLEFVQRRVLEGLVGTTAVHQGMAVLTEALPMVTLDTLVDEARLMVVLDQVSDPHNVGAIIRSAAAFKGACVIGQDRHGASMTAVLAKAASGALEKVPYIQETNIVRTLDYLKEHDFWVVGLDGQGQEDIASAVKVPKIALVLGAEGAGLRRLVKETCDTLAYIPTHADFHSLNVSNAAAVALYAASRSS
jgi:23S rRNA (guanosine2251-2'-O)-methyltransferase